MTLISSLIADAYRESNMLSLGTVPNANQTTEALRLYNALLSAIFGGQAGERLEDWPLGNLHRDDPDNNLIPFTTDQIQHPRINRRLIATNIAAITIYLACPQDGARMGIVDPFNNLAAAPVTIDGSGRPIEAAPTLLLNVNGTSREWLFRADLGSWVKLSAVAAADDNPFPAAFDMMFTCLLALRLNPRYGRTLDPQSVEMLKQNKREFVARYVQSQPLEINDDLSWPFMSRQSYSTQDGFSSQNAFNRGGYWR